ncbi:MAG: hypothetical protein LBE71_01180 [Dysgonamonadaceae bacterium]|nr:hypothetical protein [Dysgonamonadaceae bacterium]
MLRRFAAPGDVYGSKTVVVTRRAKPEAIQPVHVIASEAKQSRKKTWIATPLSRLAMTCTAQ